MTDEALPNSKINSNLPYSHRSERYYNDTTVRVEEHFSFTFLHFSLIVYVLFFILFLSSGWLVSDHKPLLYLYYAILVLVLLLLLLPLLLLLLLPPPPLLLFQTGLFLHRSSRLALDPKSLPMSNVWG